MKNINGQNNEITFIFPHDRIDCTSSQKHKIQPDYQPGQHHNHRKQQSHLNVFRHGRQCGGIAAQRRISARS